MSHPSVTGFYYAVTVGQRNAQLANGWVDDPEPVYVPLPGWGITPGDLADRPAADADLPGLAYFARDEDGGSLSAVDPETGEWEPVAPSIASQSGYVIASCWPTTIAAVAHPGTGTQIIEFPELVCAAFVMPARPVRVETNKAVITVTGGNIASVVNWAFQYRVGAGAWTTFAFSPSTETTGVATVNIGTDRARLPFPGGSVPAAGDSVQVRLGLHYTSTGRTFQPGVTSLFMRSCGFDVVVL